MTLAEACRILDISPKADMEQMFPALLKSAMNTVSRRSTWPMLF